MKKIFIYILLVIIALGSCRKVDLEPPVSTDPVFSTNLTLDGVPLNWTAGDDNLYMFTTYSKDNQGLYTLTGRFAKDDNCQVDCGESLSFSIRGNEFSIDNNFNVEEALFEDSFPFFSINSNSVNGWKYSFEGGFFDPIFGTAPSTYQWSINGNSIQDPNFDYIVLDSTDLLVRLDMTTSDGCPVYIQKLFPYGQQDDCLLDFQVVQDSTGTGGYLVTTGFNPAGDSIIWTDNMGVIFVGNTLQITPNTPLFNGIFNLYASDNLGCDVELDLCVNSMQGVIQGISIPRISYSLEEYVSGIGEQFSTVIIDYEIDGNLFSSKYGDNSNSTFSISNVEDYDDNENGERTKKLTINFSTEICIEGGVTCQTLSGDAMIGVAYPN